MAYQVVLHRLFTKEVLKLPSHHQKKAYQTLSQLKQKPTVLPANTTSLVGVKHLYRTRLGPFRLIYQIDHQHRRVVVLGIGSRGNIYQAIKRFLG